MPLFIFLLRDCFVFLVTLWLKCLLFFARSGGQAVFTNFDFSLAMLDYLHERCASQGYEPSAIFRLGCDSETVAVSVFARNDGEESVRAHAAADDDVLQFSEIDIELPISAIYHGLTFDAG